LESIIQDWGYLALAMYSFGGGMLGLAVASVFAFTGELNIYYVILVAFISNFVGDQFLFLIARNNKEQAKSMMEKHQNKIQIAHNMMDKYGWLTIIFQKYIYGIKTLIPLIIGITEYDKSKFLIFNFIASAIWAVVVGSIAYFMGQIFLDSLSEYKNYGIALLIIIILFVTYKLNKI
jgi:membrane protein DedA with SNARE-associated domain